MVQLVRSALSVPPSGVVPGTLQLGGDPAVDPECTAEPQQLPVGLGAPEAPLPRDSTDK